MRGGFAPSHFNSPLQLEKTNNNYQWFWLERGQACPPYETSAGGGEVNIANQM